jgi:DNA-binding NtrC family response regulator
MTSRHSSREAPVLSTAQPSPVHPPFDDAHDPPWPAELLGSSPLVRRLREQIRRTADGAGRAMVVAEPGLDAAAVARAIHACGGSRSAPLVEVDCANGNPAEVEAALFGPPAERSSRRSKVLESVGPDCGLTAAAGGTLYLAHVSDLPAAAQARLARIVRDGEVLVGGTVQPSKIGVRMIAGCAPTIEAEVEQGGFRADLYRRLSTIRLDVPPLRLRPEDIPAIARHVMERTALARGVAARGFTKAALALLSALPWPGNVEELAAVLGRLPAGVPSALVHVEDLLAEVGGEWRATRASGASLREAKRQFEREYIASVLRQHGWRMGEAARALGIQRTNLYRKARQLNIPRVKVTR